MLNWDLAYDYAAIYLLLIIIIWYFHEKRIPLASHRTFLVALAAVFVSTGLEIVSTKLAQMSGTEGKCWILGNKHLAASGAECDSAAVCVLCVTDRTYQCKADAACQMDAGIVWRG